MINKLPKRFFLKKKQINKKNLIKIFSLNINKKKLTNYSKKMLNLEEPFFRIFNILSKYKIQNKHLSI